MTKKIDFGIRKELTIPTAAFRVNYVASIGHNKYLMTSNKSISIYEGDNCVISLPIKTQIALYIEKYDALIYVPKEKNKFIVHFVNNIKDPVYEGPEIDHLGINHLVYSPKSETIISFGIGVRTWYFKCPLAINRRMNQKIDIQFIQRASFCEDSMNKDLYPPSFDPLTEQILYNTRQELFIYNLDGKLIDSPVTYKTENFTMFKINPFNSNFITCDLEQGLISWSKLGSVINHYPFNVKKVFTMFFVNNEFALLIDSNYKVDIIDLNTQDIFAGIQLEEKPQRFYFLQSEIPIFVSIGTKTYFYKVSTFWKQWTSLTTTVLKMTRCPSTEKSARLLFLLSNSTFAFLSPKSTNKVGVCLSQNTSFPLDYYVQRSDMKNKNRDLLKLIQNDGTFEIFQMNDIPFNSVKSLKLNATAFCHTKLREKEILIVGTTFGKILILEDNDELNELQKVTTVQEPPLKILVHEKTMSLFICYLRSIMVYNLSNLTLKYQIKQSHCEMREIFWDYLINGHDDGRIEIFSIHDDKIVTAFEENRPIHDGKITVLSKGSEFFLSAAVNGSVIVWKKNLEILAELKFPLQIYSSCFLNGTRSILFGLEKSVMIVDGSLIFDKEVDEEDFVWDNFDRRIDQFELNTYQFTKKNEISSNSSVRNSEKKNVEEEKEFDYNRKKRRNSKLIIKCLSVTAFDKVDISQDPSKTEDEKEDKKLTEDDKNKLLQDMINIDNNEKKYVPPKSEPPKVEKVQKHEEEEDDYIEEYEEEIYEQPKIVLHEKSEVIEEEKSDKNEEEEFDENINLFDDEEEEAIVKQKRKRKNVNYELPKMIKTEEENKIENEIEKEIDEEKVFKKTKERVKKAKNTIVQTPVKIQSQPKPQKPPNEPKVTVIDSPMFKDKKQKNKSKPESKKKSKSKVQKNQRNKNEENEVKSTKSDIESINSDNEYNNENEENNEIIEEINEITDEEKEKFDENISKKDEENFNENNIEIENNLEKVEEKIEENNENNIEKFEKNNENNLEKTEKNNKNSNQKFLEKVNENIDTKDEKKSNEKVLEKVEEKSEEKENLKQKEQNTNNDKLNEVKDKKKTKSNEVKNEPKISKQKSQKIEEKIQKNQNENKNEKLSEEKIKTKISNESKISSNRSKDKISLLGSKPVIKQPNFPNKNKIKPTEIRNRRNSMDSESQQSQKENSSSLLVSEEKIPEISEKQTFEEQKHKINEETPQNEEKINEISSDFKENSENSSEIIEKYEKINKNSSKTEEINQILPKISKNDEEEEQYKENDYHKAKRTNSPLENLQPKTVFSRQHLYESKKPQIPIQSPTEPKQSVSPRVNYVIMDLDGIGISQAKSTHDLIPKDMILPKIRLGKKTSDSYDAPLLSPPVRRPPLIIGQKNPFQRKILSPRPLKQQNVRNQIIYHHNKPL